MRVSDPTRRAWRRVRVPAAELRVAASMGGIVRREGEDVEGLLQRADESLYLAKENGRGQLAWEASAEGR